MLPLRSLGIIMLVVHWFAAACVSFLPETKGAAMGSGGGGGEHAVHNESGHRSVQNEEMDGIFAIDDVDDQCGNESGAQTNQDGQDGTASNLELT
jgi:hypothetical protein